MKIKTIIIILITVAALVALFFLLFSKKEEQTVTTTTQGPEARVISEGPLPKNDAEIRNEILNAIDIITNYDTMISGENISLMAQEEYRLIQVGQIAIDSLLEQINNNELIVRSFATTTLINIAQNSDQENKTKIINSLKNFIKTEINAALKKQMAAGLVSFGEKSEIPDVVSCLDSKDTILFSEPLESLANFCLKTLNYYTGQNFRYNTAEWQDWWMQNQNKIVWDDDNKKYIIK